MVNWLKRDFYLPSTEMQSGCVWQMFVDVGCNCMKLSHGKSNLDSSSSRQSSSSSSSSSSAFQRCMTKASSCWRKLVTDYWLLQFACCNTCNNDNQSSLAPLTLKSLLQLGHIFQFYNAFCFTMLIDVQYQFLIASTNDDTQ
ncbi:hypothetical protein T4A_7063 [Trichinella pseudospiralis]|uniref:Uncharacterized protein n=1 Tax=Trichinella pseudospiralis TaxID=6337 RepID=A0A0V1EPR5_TRIPS|nr:hypothetical protein T4A_7063 [Trichinella pseudospiralis]